VCYCVCLSKSVSQLSVWESRSK